MSVSVLLPYIKSKTDLNFEFHTVSDQDLLTIVNSMKHCTPGFDEISVKVLKKFKIYIYKTESESECVCVCVRVSVFQSTEFNFYVIL